MLATEDDRSFRQHSDFHTVLSSNIGGKGGLMPLKNGTSSNWCSDLYTVLLFTIGGYRGMASTEEQHSISPV